MKNDIINAPVKRPVWQNHEIVGYVAMSLHDKDFINSLPGIGLYIGFTDEEFKRSRHNEIRKEINKDD